MARKRVRRWVDWISLGEAAAQLGVSEKTVKRRLAEAGILVPRVGRAPQLTRGDFDRLVESTRGRGQPQPTTTEAPPPPRRGRYGRETDRLVARVRGQPVVALDLERKN